MNTNDLKPTPRTDIKEMIIGQCLVEGVIHPEDALRDMAKHAREIERELAERPSAKVETPLKRYGFGWDGKLGYGVYEDLEGDRMFYLADQVDALLASQAARGEVWGYVDAHGTALRSDRILGDVSGYLPLYTHPPVDQGLREAAGVRDFVVEIAENPCAYGDNCPANSGTRHGDCLPCKARRALTPPTGKKD